MPHKIMIPKDASNKNNLKGEEEAPSKGKSAMKTKKVGRGKKSYESYKPYIFKVLKTIRRETGISNKSMEIMNSFVMDIMEKISLEASKLARRNKKSTITSRDIESAVKLVLNGKLVKHAVEHGTRALEEFNMN